jgi:hypothetical protein
MEFADSIASIDKTVYPQMVRKKYQNNCENTKYRSTSFVIFSMQTYYTAKCSVRHFLSKNYKVVLLNIYKMGALKKWMNI